jgi:PilZ domain
MSPPKEQELEVIGRQVSIERRSRVRFPLELHVRYRTLGRGCSFTGAGLVVNMSSTGVLIASQHEIDAGTRLELNIEWPCMLDGLVPLQLVISGTVARCETSSFAVVLGQHQFRTTRRHAYQ